MRFMIIVKGDERVEGGAMPEEKSIAAMADYHEELAQAGKLVDCSGLQPTSKGFRIQYDSEKRTIIDGPFAETKELIGGYTIIRVDSREEALEWARRFPNPAGEGNPAEVEVRQMFELDDFEPSESVERFRQIDPVNTSSSSMSAPTPHVVVNDGQAAIDFYQRAFSARLGETHLADDGKRFMHAALFIGKGRLFLHDEFPEVGDCGGAKSPRQLEGASCTFHLDVSDADSAWQRAIDAGAEIVMPLENQFWGMRYGQLRDPFGYLWAIGSPIR